MLISTIILILVLTAAVAGLIWSVHREAHRDCSCGCGGCSLAKNCKRAALVLVAVLVALTSSGINIEHHCHHDEECAHSCTCADSSCDHADHAAPSCDHAAHTHPCDHAAHTHPCSHAVPSCDHCADCWFLHLDLDQYDQPSGLHLPDPEQVNLLFALVPALLASSTLHPALCTVHRSSSLAPPREGRHILSSVCKLTI